MKPLKIIHLTFFSIIKSPNHAAKGDDIYFVSSWAGLIARRLKQYKPELDIEIWFTDPEFNSKTEKDVFNIKGVIWPYRKPVVKNLITLDMVRKLNSLKKKNFVILHYHDLYTLRFVILLKLLCPGIKLVLSHHGGIPPKDNSIKKLLMKIYYKNSRISYITYLSTRTMKFLSEIKNHPPMKFLPVGADFNVFNPKDKQLNRVKLSLDPQKIYAIYVGSFYRLKSVDLILKVYFELREKYNFSVIFVGGTKNTQNDLYEDVVKSGCPYFETQHYLDMPRFYHAADFYIHPAFNSDFGGIDVSWMEALACGKPVMSPYLSYLDFDFSELGVVIKNEQELTTKTEWMINNYRRFSKCRVVAQKHLDGNSAIMEKLAGIYDEIYR